MQKEKSAIVCGAGGFIGHHLVVKLKGEGYRTIGIDLKQPEFVPTAADEFIIGDLRDFHLVKDVFAKKSDEVYQLAADMGGAAYLFTGEHDADVMRNSAQINLNVAEVIKNLPTKIFFSSSACIYPRYNQQDPQNPKCSEVSAYPADPDSEYGWEKLFSERLYLSYLRNYGLDVRIARFHNVFGPEGTWRGGREKSPAAICRKVAEAKDGGEIEVWGNGKQTRSYLYISECVEGVRRLMKSDFSGPVNIGSEEMVSIDELANMVIEISGKRLIIKHVPGPIGVMGRNSDNGLVRGKLNWEPKQELRIGLEQTYKWIRKQVEQISIDDRKQRVSVTEVEPNYLHAHTS